MPPIEITSLPPLAAPIWFIQFFRILGFVLHAFLMNLWLVGLPLALFLNRRGNVCARRWASRLLRQTPVFIAFGINLGIVPLLFIQYLYSRSFYPATILMAWSWFAVILLLLPAYYGVYVYVLALKKNSEAIPVYARCAGWGATFFFTIIGFLFVNALTLTTEPEMWKSLWLTHCSAGAALGTGSAIQNPELWPRFGMMFGLAFGTLAVWTLIDRRFSPSRRGGCLENGLENAGEKGLENKLENDAEIAYRRWTSRAVRLLAGTGMVLFIPCALAFASLLAKGGSLDGPLPSLINVWLVGPVATFLAVAFLASSDKKSAIFSVLCVQLASLSIFACVRLLIQSLQLESHLPLERFAVETDWGPMILFLGVFVLGATILLWMLRIAVRSVYAKPGREDPCKEGA